jgi:hypothetical protein
MPDQKKAPLANLCSQLVVNEYPLDPSIPERQAYALPTPAEGLFPSTRMPMRASVQRLLRWRRITASGISDLEWRHSCCCAHQPRPRSSAARQGCSIPAGPNMTCIRPIWPYASRQVWPLTPPVAPPLRTDPRADSFRQRQGPFPRATRQRRCFPGPKRLPPTNPLHPRLVLTLEPRPRGPPLVLRLCRLSPASDMGSRAGFARQTLSLGRLSPELQGHMPFVDFCNFRDPRARPPIRQTPPHLRWQATAQRAAPPPCGFGTSRIATAQGSRTPEGPSTPTSTSARQSGFTPTCFVRTPLVAR